MCGVTLLCASDAQYRGHLSPFFRSMSLKIASVSQRTVKSYLRKTRPSSNKIRQKVFGAQDNAPEGDVERRR